MNVYHVFDIKRLTVGHKEEPKDKGRVSEEGIKKLFGVGVAPSVCWSTVKLAKGMQYTKT